MRVVVFNRVPNSIPFKFGHSVPCGFAYYLFLFYNIDRYVLRVAVPCLRLRNGGISYSRWHTEGFVNRNAAYRIAVRNVRGAP